MIAGKGEIDLAGPDHEGEPDRKKDQRRKRREKGRVDEGLQENLRRRVHEQRQEQRKDENDRQAFETLETGRDARGAAMAAPSRLVLQFDQVLGQFDDRHVLGLDLGDDRAAIQDHQPIGHFVHMSEVVLDVDAGAAG